MAEVHNHIHIHFKIKVNRLIVKTTNLFENEIIEKQNAMKKRLSHEVASR